MKTSIHIKPCLISSSEAHNQRLKPLDYTRADLSHLNEVWRSIFSAPTLREEMDEIKRAYFSAKGKKMHAKATPIREGVIVISPDTTMADLRKFAEVCQDQWGIKPLQIYVHRDEGHWDGKEWHPNHHAHIVWRWCDDQGVTCKLGREDMAQMQTILAEIIQMDRGVSSDKVHIDALAYKLKKVEEKERLRVEESIRRAGEELRDALRKKEEGEIALKTLEKRIQDLKASSDNLGEINTALSKKNEEIQDDIKKAEEEARRARGRANKEMRGALGWVGKQLIGANKRDQDKKKREIETLRAQLEQQKQEVIDELNARKEEQEREIKSEEQELYQRSLELDRNIGELQTQKAIVEGLKEVFPDMIPALQAKKYFSLSVEETNILLEEYKLTIPAGRRCYNPTSNTSFTLPEETELSVGKSTTGNWELWARVRETWKHISNWMEEMWERVRPKQTQRRSRGMRL